MLVLDGCPCLSAESPVLVLGLVLLGEKEEVRVELGGEEEKRGVELVELLVVELGQAEVGLQPGHLALDLALELHDVLLEPVPDALRELSDLLIELILSIFFLCFNQIVFQIC